MPSQTSFVLFSASGQRFNAVEEVSRINTGGLDGPSSIPGLSSFRLGDGRRLNKKDENTFEIVATGERLYRNAP